MTATLRATAAIAIRMIKEENDLDLLTKIKEYVARDKEYRAHGSIWICSYHQS
jgi:hypothetical protein